MPELTRDPDPVASWEKAMDTVKKHKTIALIVGAVAFIAVLALFA